MLTRASCLLVSSAFLLLMIARTIQLHVQLIQTFANDSKLILQHSTQQQIRTTKSSKNPTSPPPANKPKTKSNLIYKLGKKYYNRMMKHGPQVSTLRAFEVLMKSLSRAENWKEVAHIYTDLVKRYEF